MQTTNRYWAATVASFAVMLVIGGALLVMAIYGEGLSELPAPAIGQGFFFIFLFGWPMALIAAWAVTLLATPLSKIERDPRRGRTVVVTSAVLGGVLVPAAWALMWGAWSGVWPVVVLGIAAGAVGGLTYRALLRQETSK